MKESDHTPAAFSPPTTDGEDNLTQPSGEQPTSVDLKEKYEDYALKLGQRRGERTYEITEKTLDDLIAEERRQAKITELELLQSKSYDGSWTDHDEYAAYIQPRLTELKRGENNE